MQLQHDGTIDLATGRNRHTKQWKNKEWTWSALLTKLSNTHRTPETLKEYLSDKKDRQDEIKDIGGFVGGFLTGGHRRAGSVLHRQLVTLDADFATTDLWDDFTLSFDHAAAIYSTHKHSADSPRYRLLIPLDREVTPEEYVAISRRIAGNLGIEAFDPTTYQPVRLMYWPSTAKDAEYVFEYQDGEWLSADEVLATYKNWRDWSEYPTGQKEKELIFRGTKKQGEPHEKVGIVGAFCRTYSIREAIATFLPDIYEPTDMEDRYSFVSGSTSGGLVIYEDKFAYSHHSSDPAGEKLCNAFDLVRLHKFGLQDEDCAPDTPVNKLPSHVAMEDLCTKDKRVRMAVVSERLAAARADFEGDTTDTDTAEDTPDGLAVDAYGALQGSTDTPVSDEWRTELDVDKKGGVHSTIANIAIILENDEVFKDNIAFDQFEGRGVFKKGLLPWRRVTHKTRFIADQDLHLIEHYLESVYGIGGSEKLIKALSHTFTKTTFHPVKDYLYGLKWDGVKRLDTVFIDYMGVADSRYVREVTRKTLVAAVARVTEPGCKFDYVLTLVGAQGQRKSTILSKLGRAWFTDSFNFHKIKSKEGYEVVQGSWIIEIMEMSGMSKTEVEMIKGFISSQKDKYRSAYGRVIEDRYRQCIFFGTTNKEDFLRDQTGNRRFWPLSVDYDNAAKTIEQLTDKEVGQIWAEAVAAYRQGELLYLDAETEEEAKEWQAQHTEVHPWEEKINAFLSGKVTNKWGIKPYYERLDFYDNPDNFGDEIQIERDRVCVDEIWKECLRERGTIDERGAAAIRSILRKRNDWRTEKRAVWYGIYGRQRNGFVMKNSNVKVDEK